MKPEKRDVVDLRAYRMDKARAAREAEEKARAARKTEEQPLLGQRPGAPMIIVLLIAVFVLAWFATKHF